MTIALDPDQLDITAIEAGLVSQVDVPAGLNGMVKRSFDIILALSVLLFTLPLLGAVALLVWAQDRGPIIFKQKRCGRNGIAFTVYKFRTMKLDAPQTLRELLQNNPEAAAEWQRDQKLRHDPRITKLGTFLRKSSLDELPQLLNILRGDMSIIGPRPVTYSELPRYGSKLVYYMAARPGVTGLWQVNGRNELNYEQRIAFDADYVQNWSHSQDIKILVKTVPAVLMSKGAF